MVILNHYWYKIYFNDLFCWIVKFFPNALVHFVLRKFSNECKWKKCHKIWEFFGPRNVRRSGQKQILTSTYIYVHTMNLKQANDVFFLQKKNKIFICFWGEGIGNSEVGSQICRNPCRCGRPPNTRFTFNFIFFSPATNLIQKSLK